MNLIGKAIALNRKLSRIKNIYLYTDYISLIRANIYYSLVKILSFNIYSQLYTYSNI